MWLSELSVRGEEGASNLLDAERGRIKLEGVLQEREEDYARTQEQLEDFKRFVQEGGGGGGMLDEGEDMFDHGHHANGTWNWYLLYMLVVLVV